jgi:predicted NACHT family NTPase
LDGFDEIDFAHRDAISKQILDLSANYPRATIVVSSRPDEKFSAWQTFYIFTMRALDKGQVLELINKIDYDEALKERFKREVDSRLYKSHTSFLSSRCYRLLCC